MKDFARLLRAGETIPLLSLAASAFILSGREFSPKNIFSFVLPDLLITFLALSYAYSLNEFLDNFLDFGKVTGPFRRAAANLALIFGCGLASAALAISLFSKGAYAPLLLTFLLLFTLYSLPFPRLRNIPGADFLTNVLSFLILYLKSAALYEAAPNWHFILFLAGFFSITEAVHQIAHRAEDVRSGRKTLFGSFLQRNGALLLCALFFTAALASKDLIGCAFSSLRGVLIFRAREGDFSRLRKSLLGREELTLRIALSLLSR